MQHACFIRINPREIVERNNLPRSRNLQCWNLWESCVIKLSRQRRSIRLRERYIVTQPLETKDCVVSSSMLRKHVYSRSCRWEFVILARNVVLNPATCPMLNRTSNRGGSLSNGNGCAHLPLPFREN